MYIYICIYDNHINFRPVHFSCYGIFKTMFRHFSFSSFILASYNICIQSLFAVEFYSFALEID